MILLLVILIFKTVIICHCQELQKTETRYICHEKFEVVGGKCYHFSKVALEWQETHFYCNNLNSSISAKINSRPEQAILRKYMLNRPSLKLQERWIDGFYNWNQKIWVWATSGEKIVFNKLSKKEKTDRQQWRCISIDPRRKNRWSSKLCTEKKHFICESKTKAAIEFKVYNKKKKNKFNIDKCTENSNQLTKYEERRCLKLLGTTVNGLSNEPGYLSDPKSTQSTLNNLEYICPANMVNLGNKCYSFSTEKLTWSDAYFGCLQNHTKLVVIKGLNQDHNLRRYLNNFIEKEDRWIGATYNHKSSKWTWTQSGQPLQYQGFDKSIQNRNESSLFWNAAYMDPALANRWNAASQLLKKRFICQVKGEAVKKLSSMRLKPPQATITIFKKSGKK